MLVICSSFVFINKPDLFPCFLQMGHLSLSSHLYFAEGRSCTFSSFMTQACGNMSPSRSCFCLYSHQFSSGLLEFDIGDETQTHKQIVTWYFPQHPCSWFRNYTWERSTKRTDNPSQQKINTLVSHQCKSDALERDKEFTCKHFWHLALSHGSRLMTEAARALSAGEPPRAPKGGTSQTCPAIRRI